MSLANTTKRRLIGLLRRVPPGLRQLVPGSIRRRVRRQLRDALGRVNPTLSVIVPVYNVEAYLCACLDSVLAQDVAGLEVIVVDDGSTDGSPAIIADYAAKDRRVRAFRQDNAGQGPARNLGVSHARGELITFVDADDMIPAGAYAHMVGALRTSGSDFSVGAARRLQGGRYHRPPWHAVVHEHDRIGITIEDFPAALADVIACNRVFRRKFWFDKVGGFPGGMAYEDHVPMVAAYLRAERFDLLASVTYDWRIRDEGTSTGQQKHELRNLADRVAVKADARRLVEAEASEPVRAAWIGRVLDIDFDPFIDHALLGDDEYRAILGDAYATYVALATPAAMGYVRVQQKVRSHLASKGAWDQIEIAQQFFRDHTSLPPTKLASGRIVLDDTLSGLLREELPPEVLELSKHESRMQACAFHAEWIGPTSFRLTGWALIRGIDLQDRSPSLELWLARTDGSNRLDLNVERVNLSEATRWVGWPHGSFDGAGFRTVIDFIDLTGTGGATQDWRLRLRVTVDGITREGGIYHTVADSSASRAAITSQRVSADGVVAVPRFDAEHGLTFTLRRPGIVAERLEPEFGDREVRARIRNLGAEPFVPVAVRAIEKDSGSHVEGTISHSPGGTQAFSLHMGATATPSGTDWELRAVDRDHRTRPVEWPIEEARTVIPTGDDLYWRRSPRGYVRMAVDQPNPGVSGVDVSGAEIAARVDWEGASEEIVASARLVATGVTVPLISSHRTDDGLVLMAFPTSVSRFGLPARPIASGSYALEVTDGSDGVHGLSLDPSFAATLPEEHLTDTHRVRIGISGQRELCIGLSAPLADDEVSAHSQQLLRAEYAAADPQPEDAILFHPDPDEGATDRQLAMHEELHRRGQDVTLYWSVADYSTWLPVGARPLLIGSREWYAKLASVRYLCISADLGAFFRKRPHQRYVRTLEDVPSAQVGDGKG